MITRVSAESTSSISRLSTILEVSRQAYYQRLEMMQKDKYQIEIVLELVTEWRKLMPRVGGRKLYRLLSQDFVSLNYKLGRDAFFDILRQYNLLVKRRKSYTKTTNSFHHYYVYKNLIMGLEIVRSNQVFVADITYIRVSGNFMYLSLITDLYSRRIMGWNLGESLDAACSVEALRMAIEKVESCSSLIHHSDRGIQYCSRAYTKILLDNKISISMAEAGNPYENAVAERVNGILKDEFFLNQTFISKRLAMKATEQAIRIYNEARPHLSLKMKTPAQKYFENKISTKNFFPPRGEVCLDSTSTQVNYQISPTTDSGFINN